MKHRTSARLIATPDGRGHRQRPHLGNRPPLLRPGTSTKLASPRVPSPQIEGPPPPNSVGAVFEKRNVSR